MSSLRLNDNNVAAVCRKVFRTIGAGDTFQFPDPTQDHSMKKLFLGFLLQKVAARCTENTVVIITNAEVLFPAEGRNREQLNPVYETAIGQYAQKIRNKGTLVLSTKSPLKMREDICNAYDIGLFYYLSNPRDRQWLANRQALGPRQSELNQLLATLHQEGLMFREDLVFHFVPHLLEPIDLEVTVPQESVRPASVGRLCFRSTRTEAWFLTPPRTMVKRRPG